MVLLKIYDKYDFLPTYVYLIGVAQPAPKSYKNCPFMIVNINLQSLLLFNRPTTDKEAVKSLQNHEILSWVEIIQNSNGAWIYFCKQLV